MIIWPPFFIFLGSNPVSALKGIETADFLPTTPTVTGSNPVSALKGIETLATIVWPLQGLTVFKPSVSPERD